MGDIQEGETLSAINYPFHYKNKYNYTEKDKVEVNADCIYIQEGDTLSTINYPFHYREQYSYIEKDGTTYTSDFSGYQFKEWNTKIDGSGEIFDENTIVTQDMTVYSVMKETTLEGGILPTFNYPFHYEDKHKFVETDIKLETTTQYVELSIGNTLHVKNKEFYYKDDYNLKQTDAVISHTEELKKKEGSTLSTNNSDFYYNDRYKNINTDITQKFAEYLEKDEGDTLSAMTEQE